MKYALRSTLLALVAVFALGAVVASAASAAEPEFKPMPAKKKFTSTSGSVTFYAPDAEITCTSSTTSGEITGATTIGKVFVKYVGCKVTLVRGTCAVTSEGAKSGEIVTLGMKGQLGTVATTEAASGVGVLLLPESGYFATLDTNCWYLKGRLAGEVAAEVTPIGKKSTSLSLVFAHELEGQKIHKITIGGKSRNTEGLEAYSGPIGLQATDSLTFEEALEVT